MRYRVRMTELRATRLVCHHCAVTLSPDDGDHYGYECHDCVMREHELVLTWRRDPDHPDVGRLFAGPVDLGLGLAEARRGRAA